MLARPAIGSPSSQHQSVSTADLPLVRLALVLALPAIGFDQALHVDAPVVLRLPVYELLHWLSDSLLALPLAMFAVWAGGRIARGRGFTLRQTSEIVAQACICASVFALLLIPAAFVHDALDTATHADLLTASHGHLGVRPQTSGPAVVATSMAHALTDALEAQALGVPALILGLYLSGKKRNA